MNCLARIWWTAKGVGWDNLPRRLLQVWRIRSGRLRRQLDPARFTDDAFRNECDATVSDQPTLWAERARKFFPVPSQQDLAKVVDDPTWDEHVYAVCRKALEGEYLFFSHWYGRLGWPPDFNLDPMHDIRWPVGEHWLGTAKSGPPRHDIKLVWEASRFSLAYYFARAYVRKGDEKWAESYWQMFDAWVEQNPPQLTVAWGCGQEIAFRLMAMLFGAFATLTSPAATDERLWALSRLAWQTGRQIATNINSARSQKNNHALSEAAGLWTIGLLFPEFRQARRWRDTGWEILAAEAKRQIYNDGSYVQHSLNYHRVMMDDLLWAIRLGEMNDDRLPEAVYDRFERATNWLMEMIDPDSGRVPNYGANDGANVLPLACSDYLDYRPVAQAGYSLLRGRRCFAPGPWDEKVLWLLGDEAVNVPVEPPKRQAQFAADSGGYYILRGPNSWAMIRCHTYRDRPGQGDMLHLDLWYKGVNVLRDAGSYMYYCEQPWRHYFISTAAHNTIEIDARDQMIKGARFLWFRWTKSRLLRFETSADARVGYFEGEHYGYRRLPGRPVHRRSVLRIDDTYIIVHDILGSGRHDVALRWRLCEGDWIQGEGLNWRADTSEQPVALNITASGPIDAQLVAGGESPMPEGWTSEYYAEKKPAPTILAEISQSLPTRLVTIWNPGGQGEVGLTVDKDAFNRPGLPTALTGLPPELKSAVQEASGGRIWG